MTTCTTEDCNRQTSLYLCTDCIVELDSLLADVGPLLQFIGGAIDQTAVTRSPGASGGGGGVAKSRPAMNVDAYLLRAWLHQLPARAYDAAADNPDAGKILFMARDWIQKARDLVWGPEDSRVYGRCEEPLEGEDGDDSPIPCDGRLVAHPDDATVKCPECNTVHNVSDVLAKLRRKVRGEPMTPSGVRDLLRAKAKAVITKKDIENWVSRGKLRYVLDHVSSNSRDRKIYYPGDVLQVFEDMRARNRALM
ncbi:hypothetical protein [Paenarthrobacter sp. YJN-5]|uniref:hypothetical protein n=1 Tax=Paenarthrobacter sp. YJN-5 TaxID=2735316 RepID=UPI001878B95F|nr:hypothetical protein [Paenarthrobacter sp. YJN-5]QOT16494.1 hypothetical protein HMI59_07675 [Paenarthrobacter sp. YJN-5]